MPAFEGVALSDASPYVWNILRYTDWQEIDACIAPRPVLIASNSGDNWWPLLGYKKVVRSMEKVYRLYGVTDRFRHIRDRRSHDMTPYIPQIAPWIDRYIKTLPRSKAPPLPCGKPENPDCSMLRYLQRRIARQSASFPGSFPTKSAWKTYRGDIVRWLRRSCDLDSMRPGADEVVAVSENKGIVVETLKLGLDVDFACPALLFRPPESGAGTRAAVILSHDDGQCIASPTMANAARKLAAAGYWVILPEHASLNPASLRPAKSNALVSFYGVADTVGLPPLALRVADDMAALRYLLTRPEIDKGRITAVGLGTGALDACLAAVLDDRIKALASLGPTTARDWSESVAPRQHRFDRIMPYLPSLLTKTDFDYLHAAVAPRTLLLIDVADTEDSPRGFQQVAATARKVSRLCDHRHTLLVLNARELADRPEEGRAGGLQKQLMDAARAVLPPAGPPGVIGNEDGLISRSVVDTSPGVLWVVQAQSGYRQRFPDGNYRLDNWSFFNDNRAAQQDRLVSPLIFHKEPGGYKLTGIGKARTNGGTGRQTFPFDLVAGSDAVGKEYYFGWHTGDLSGPRNAGVVEYDDETRGRMAILTFDGKTPNQKVAIGRTYRVKLHVPRTYSIQAVSKPK